jgi:hypothetical protein
MNHAHGNRLPTWLVFSVALLASAMLAGCGAMTTVRSHPDFADSKRIVRTVAVLPSDVESVKLNFTGENEHDLEAEESLRTELDGAVEQTLQNFGYQPRRTLLDTLGKQDKQLSFEFEQFKESYGRASQELYQKARIPESEAKNFKAGVGPAVIVLALAAEADALFFVRYRAYTKSGGMVAKDIIAASLLAAVTGVVAVPAKDSSAVEVALIDGVTGDILWSNIARQPRAGTAVLGVAFIGLPRGRASELAVEPTPGSPVAVVSQPVASQQAQAGALPQPATK